MDEILSTKNYEHILIPNIGGYDCWQKGVLADVTNEGS